LDSLVAGPTSALEMVGFELGSGVQISKLAVISPPYFMITDVANFEILKFERPTPFFVPPRYSFETQFNPSGIFCDDPQIRIMKRANRARFRRRQSSRQEL
jgi:hypothetical protein